MMEERQSGLNSIALVGGYRVAQNPYGFRLMRLDTVSEEFPAAESFVFKSGEDAIDIGKLLSMAFRNGFSSGTSSFRIGGVGSVEVSGGEKPSCKLYRLNEKGEKELFSKPESKEQLVEALSLLLERKDAS